MHTRLPFIHVLSTPLGANVHIRKRIKGHNELCLAKDRGCCRTCPSYGIRVVQCEKRDVVVAPKVEGVKG